MKIVVLAGGLSPERNVSLSSGCKVCIALRQRGHQVAFVDMFLGTQAPVETLFDAPLDEELTRVGRVAPDLEQVKASRTDGGASQFGPGVLELCAQADVVFLALHGACGEDGRVQAALDLMGIPYTGSNYLGSAIAMDKDLTKRIVAPLGVQTPSWELVDYTAADIPGLVERLEVPCVVKHVDYGSSIGVSIPRTKEELQAALEEAWSWAAAVWWSSMCPAGKSRWAFWKERPFRPLRSSPKRDSMTMRTSTSPGRPTRSVLPRFPSSGSSGWPRPL